MEILEPAPIVDLPSVSRLEPDPPNPVGLAASKLSFGQIVA